MRSMQKVFIFLIAVALIFTALNGQVYAANGLTLSTSYPGMSVRPGEVVEFFLEIENSSLPAQSIELATKSLPKGWTAHFEGAGKTVHQVFVKKGDTQSVSYKVQVPAEIKEGTYKIQISAAGAGVSDSLTLELKVTSDAQSASKLVSQYPELQGPGSALFTFRADLTNNSGKEQSYSLGAKAPAGWEVSFKPSYDNKQIASLSLGPGKSQGLDIQVEPPVNIEAGEYSIPISAVSGEETISTELKVIITGTYDLELTTPTGQLNIESTAGKEKTVVLKVSNTGSADLQGIKLSSYKPSNWTVTFEKEQIDLLKAGESQEVKAFVTPDSKAIAGDYVVTMVASNPEARDEAEFRVLVKTSTLRGFVGLAIIGAIGFGLYKTFQVYGRR